MRLEMYAFLSAILLADTSWGSFLNPHRYADIYNTTEELLEKVRAVEASYKDGVEAVLKFVLPIVVRANSELEISPECTDAILKLVFSFRQMKSWAFKMIDASGKFPSGVLSGTSAEVGAFDQCLDLKVHSDYNEQVLFRGQYCTLEFFPYLPPKPHIYKINGYLPIYNNVTSDFELTSETLKLAHFSYFMGFRLGLCLPSACTLGDVQEMTKMVNVGLKPVVTRCETKEEFSFSQLQIVVLSVFSILALFVILGTATEIVTHFFYKGKSDGNYYCPEVLIDTVTSFSIRSNTKNLLRVDKKGKLSSLHGIKFLSMTWVIIGHTYMFWDFQFIRSIYSTAIVELPKFAFQAVANSLIAVDTFFFVTGILISYLTLTTAKNYGKEAFNSPLFIIQRFWRLFPSTVALVGLTFLLPLMGSGPNWHDTIDVVVNNCLKNWWANLIFANNFLDHTDVCLIHSWYTAADMQMYFLALLFFVIFFKKEDIGLLYLFLLTVASMVSLAVINIWLDLPPTVLPSLPDPDQQLELANYLHFKPNSHLAPYAIGLELGYLLVKQQPIQIHPILQVVGWMLATVCNMTVLYSTCLWNGNEMPNMAESALYASLHGAGWSLGLAWMVYMCATDRGGFINSLLSWSVFQPLSRLTFFAYLLHCLVIWVFVGNLRGPIDAHQLFAVWIILGNVTVSYGLAYVGYVLVEAPAARLYKLLMRKLLSGKMQEKEQNRIYGNEDGKKSAKEKILTIDRDGVAVYHL